ncbi:MAG: permease [Ignavibacteria bacterium GWB2_35_12]|nr:MAG: permease [Ignavibacteria bacterium GWB2_35_12]OGU87892.1 MAG: permease [Ignavibacteria bacterium RIFOXYA2_FULL_35_10]OGV21753.1 MAG: permease [Ignavibacteria bacterium RIFOXYC2_FULL_35_21]
MEWKKEIKIFIYLAVAFILFYNLPIGNQRFDGAIFEALELMKWYAQEHVILCLLPAFYIAGAIGVFVSQNSVMKYLGPKANKKMAYGVGSVSGSILAVCSCTVLPIFTGIYMMGAGLGPAIAFLYSGPAINVLAIILSGKVLGIEIAVARTVGAVSFAIVIGLIMAFIFRKEEIKKIEAAAELPEPETPRPLWQTIIFFGLMIIILVFSNWAKPDTVEGFWFAVYSSKWIITSVAALIFGIVLALWYKANIIKLVAIAAIVAVSVFIFDNPSIPFGVAILGLTYITITGNDELKKWFESTWTFAKQIMPLLFIGVLFAGFMLGRPGHEGIIPSVWISDLVGGNSLFANFISSIIAAFMYFATLTEVPILQGLMGSGMGKGPALALLLAGPALSLPSMLVIKSVIGTKKTVIYVSLVVFFSTIVGFIFGLI